MIPTMTATCAWCDAELDETWVDVSALGDATFTTVRGRSQCPTIGCVPRCPVCRREPGDIHGPKCGDIMARKLGDLRPATITREDCGVRRRR